MSATVASRVVLSVTKADAESQREGVDTEWILDELRGHTYETYLKRVHGGRVAVGDEWEEFVSCGCATPADVVLRVESVEGGTELGSETTLDVRPRRDIAETA